jgi:hypothetical protein
MDQRIVYDALTMPVADLSMISIAVFGSIGFAAMAAASWVQLRKKPSRRSEDPTMEMMARVLMTLMAAVEVGYLFYSGVQTVRWRYDYARHRYVVLDGCVAQFREKVQSDHDLGVDDFSLQGRSFRLSDSSWRVGYHLSHHHGSPIEEGVHLRVFARGQRLLRIEVVPTPCPL